MENLKSLIAANYGVILEHTLKLFSKSSSTDPITNSIDTLLERWLQESSGEEPKSVLTCIKALEPVLEESEKSLASSIATEQAGTAANKKPLTEAKYPVNLKQLVKYCILKRIYQNFLEERSLFNLTEILEVKLWSRYKEKDSILFDAECLGGIQNLVTLFSIILLTDYDELIEGRSEIYNEVLVELYDAHMGKYSQEYPEVSTNMELVLSQDKKVMQQTLEKYKDMWKRTVPDLSYNLDALVTIFVALVFHGEQQGKVYHAGTRYMLKCIFRNLKNGDFHFTNFQILNSLESLIMKHTNEKDRTGSLGVEVLKQIRNTSITSISDHSQHIDQVKPLDHMIEGQVSRPEKLIFEKISDSKTYSRSIVICISGFTSEDAMKVEEWRAVCQIFPNSEVIALNWKSNTAGSIANELYETIKKDGLPKGNWKQTLFAGITKVAETVQGASKQWKQTYDQAKITGKYLAHLLAKTDLFKGYAVSIMGFSLGTLVTMSCVWELEALGRYDIIYDVLLMGGVVNLDDFPKYTLKSVQNRVMNCYSLADFVLQNILKSTDANVRPIGLGPMNWNNRKVRDIDLTSVADGHTKYRDVLQKILVQTDFNEDLEYLF